MGALEGNNNRLALKDPEIRQKAYKLFCDHLAKGSSIKSWWYEDDLGNACTWETMLSYIKDNPLEFDSIHKQIAESKGFAYWESVVAASAVGTNEKANTASLQMIMRNKFGWDKEAKQDNQNQNRALATNYPKLDPNDIRVSIQVSPPQLPTSDTLGS
jgi:hypothetical protein